MYYPMVLNPVLHKRIWGSHRLATVLNKTLPDDEKYGESWEFHDTCTVANGVFSGRILGELVKEYGESFIGNGNNPNEGLPLLAKFLDASDWLSVQVHPNDEQAQQLEGQARGKTEAWLIIDADENAQMVAGVHEETTPRLFKDAIKNGNLEDFLMVIYPKAGDVYYLPANTVHALGAGLLVYEIQQSSDLTYRLYDWNRVDKDGKSRELHIEKGVAVANLEFVAHQEEPIDEETLLQKEFFTTLCHQAKQDPRMFHTHNKFQIITNIRGTVTIHVEVGSLLLPYELEQSQKLELLMKHSEAGNVTLEFGQTAMIPAAISAFELSGDGMVLRSFQS
jgi:mannose-6-phosphate isomerase